MAVVYHAVPSAMVGSVLYPLHELARLSGDAFQRQQAKYAGRESVLEARITAAGLRFNDAIHCAPLHPHRLAPVFDSCRPLPSSLPDAFTSTAGPLDELQPR